MNKYLAEFIGTFALVFAGTGAIVVNDLTNGAVSHVGISLTFGLVVMSMIYALGDISGAHLNPRDLGILVCSFFFRQTASSVSRQPVRRRNPCKHDALLSICSPDTWCNHTIRRRVAVLCP